MTHRKTNKNWTPSLRCKTWWQISTKCSCVSTGTMWHFLACLTCWDHSLCSENAVRCRQRSRLSSRFAWTTTRSRISRLLITSSMPNRAFVTNSILVSATCIQTWRRSRLRVGTSSRRSQAASLSFKCSIRYRCTQISWPIWSIAWSTRWILSRTRPTLSAMQWVLNLAPQTRFQMVRTSWQSKIQLDLKKTSKPLRKETSNSNFCRKG